MLAVQVCETMGWTYFEYLEQPLWFIEALLIKWKEETRYNKENQK